MRGVVSNNYVIKEDYCELIVIGGKNDGLTFLIDIEDIPRCKEFIWHGQHTRLHKYGTTIKPNRFLLHRFLMKAKNKDIIVDHINGNTLDNRKSNLRICTKQQNTASQGMRSDNTSGHKCIVWYPYNGVNKWMVNIQVHKKKIHIGYYDRLEDAIIARDKAYEKYFGEYARMS